MSELVNTLLSFGVKRNLYENLSPGKHNENIVLRLNPLISLRTVAELLFEKKRLIPALKEITVALGVEE